jgi:hypothetical protein
MSSAISYAPADRAFLSLRSVQRSVWTQFTSEWTCLRRFGDAIFIGFTASLHVSEGSIGPHSVLSLRVLDIRRPFKTHSLRHPAAA